MIREHRMLRSLTVQLPDILGVEVSVGPVIYCGNAGRLVGKKHSTASRSLERLADKFVAQSKRNFKHRLLHNVGLVADPLTCSYHLSITDREIAFSAPTFRLLATSKPAC